MSPTRSVTVRKTSNDDRRAQTRQQILEATRTLLSQGESFARMSIPRIVSEAGISRATFYLHFRSKRALMAALGEAETADWRTIAEPFLTNPHAGREVLERAIEQLVEVWRAHRAVLAGIIELCEYDEEASDGWRDTVHEIARVIGSAVRVRRPRFSADQAEDLGRLIVWAGERYLHQEARQVSPEQDRRLVASLTEMIWSLMRPAAGE